jgi:hypothetical protein
MSMSRTVAIACVAALAMAGCVSTGAVSRKLEVGMTEKQVTELVGSEPSSVSVSTCGSSTPHPWQCKEYQYKSAWDGRLTLMILFHQEPDGTWHVNSWNAY